MKYVIFDLDNCLADDRARIPLIDWSETNLGKRYDAYHRNVGDDPVGNYDTFSEAVACGWLPIFLTARPHTVGNVDVRTKTQLWLQEHFGVAVENCILLMRNVGDHRSSVELKREQLVHLFDWDINIDDVVCAYDDRPDIVAMYRERGIPAHVMSIHDVCAYKPPTAAREVNAGDVLGEMAATFRERSGTYKDNYKMVPKLCEILFPGGVPPEVIFTPQWHLFELKLVKLSRFAISGLQHLDSIHDDAVYSAMIEACLLNEEKMK